jgi:hypothetical protein
MLSFVQPWAVSCCRTNIAGTKGAGAWDNCWHMMGSLGWVSESVPACLQARRTYCRRRGNAVGTWMSYWTVDF